MLMVAPRPVTSHPAAFSIVECAVAIAIVAFAFVSLFALLPAGLTTFRAAIDATNEGRIVGSIDSMLQATEFEDIGPKMDFAQSSAVFYYDEEGIYLGRENASAIERDPILRAKAVYSVKLFLQPRSTHSRTAVILMSSIASEGYRDFSNRYLEVETLSNSLTSGTLNHTLRVRTLVLAKMDGVKLAMP